MRDGDLVARNCLLIIGLVLAACWVTPARSQLAPQSFPTGGAAAAWEHWRTAMLAILDRKPDEAEVAFERLLTLQPSALRIALLADVTVNQTNLGGGVLLLEQDIEADALRESGRRVGELLLEGRERLNEADDGWFFASIGRFDIADANFRSLLDANPDPVALLEFADRTRKRRELLVMLADNPVVGESCRAVLKLLDRGEVEIKADPARIQENIARLAGPPRAFENSSAALRDSGEFAVAFMIQTLRDPGQKALTPAILRALPQLGRPALNPLVYALRVPDPVIRRYVIESLGQIGYVQALPYLRVLVEDSSLSAEQRAVADQAMSMLRRGGFQVERGVSPAQAFYRLAEEYYADAPSLAADMRLETANVWYWRNDTLFNVKVPTPIFNEIMAMRCCEEALRLDPESKPALALWLAANLRREAELPEGAVDATRPADYPSALYFAQTAGSEYCQMALSRAIERNEAAVALGLIEALNNTAGAASLLSGEGGRTPLADALSFPDRLVRIRAALALARANPDHSFPQAQNLLPALSEALRLHSGAQHALVVDPDQDSANTVAAALRATGYQVTTDSSLYTGLSKARAELPGLDVIILASDIREPRLPESFEQLRTEYRFAGVPVIVVTRPGDRDVVRTLVRRDPSVADVDPNPSPEILERAIARVARATGARPISPENGTQISLEAANSLKQLAATGSRLFDPAAVEPALLDAFAARDESLRLAVAQVLGYVGTPKAQEAIARAALNAEGALEYRQAMFAALAEAAKVRGRHIGDDVANELLAVAAGEPDLVLREAASRAVGALNLPGTPASEIIRNQYAG